MDLMDRFQSVENFKEMFEVNCMLFNFSFYCSGEKKSIYKLNNFFVRIIRNLNYSKRRRVWILFV